VERPLPFILAASLGMLIVVNAAPRLGRWSGDALIHLSLAERFAEGRPFQFNAGEVTSGSSSLGWTVVSGTIFRAFGPAGAAYLMPAVATIALLATAALVYRLARRLGASTLAAALGGLAFLAVPGVTYNGVFPMEASTFALAALAFALSLEGALPERRAVLASGALLAASVLLRPEGVVLGALPLLDPASRRRALPIYAIAFGLVLPMVFLHHAATGLWVPGSAVSRLMAARRVPFAMHVLGPIWIYGDVLVRLVAYAPLAALGLSSARRRAGEDPLARRLGAMVVLGLSLYVLATGAYHVARLTLWLLAALAALAPAEAERLARSPGFRSRALVMAAGALFLAVATSETVMRLRNPFQVHGGMTAVEVMQQHEARRASTDMFRSAVCAGGCCVPGVTPAIALVEVQARWFLDDRLAVASLDGRTRALLGPGVTFAKDGCIAPDEVLADPSVVGVLAPPVIEAPRCAQTGLASAVMRAWGGAVPAPPGFTWDEKIHGFVRSCAAR
jgi:hypothetical protein